MVEGIVAGIGGKCYLGKFIRVLWEVLQAKSDGE
jgi:hypothetical protein